MMAFDSWKTDMNPSSSVGGEYREKVRTDKEPLILIRETSRCTIVQIQHSELLVFSFSGIFWSWNERVVSGCGWCWALEIFGLAILLQVTQDFFTLPVPLHCNRSAHQLLCTRMHFNRLPLVSYLAATDIRTAEYFDYILEVFMKHWLAKKWEAAGSHSFLT